MGWEKGKQTYCLSYVVFQNWRCRKGRYEDGFDAVGNLVHFRQGRGVKSREGREVKSVSLKNKQTDKKDR
jgi:hypothetical protein